MMMDNQVRASRNAGDPTKRIDKVDNNENRKHDELFELGIIKRDGNDKYTEEYRILDKHNKYGAMVVLMNHVIMVMMVVTWISLNYYEN